MDRSDNNNGPVEHEASVPSIGSSNVKQPIKSPDATEASLVKHPQLSVKSSQEWMKQGLLHTGLLHDKQNVDETILQEGGSTGEAVLPDAQSAEGVLKRPRDQFLEDSHPMREGVALIQNVEKSADILPAALWTKISRKLVDPEALTIGQERFEVKADFVIVLRPLHKEEIEAYSAATMQLRGMIKAFSE